MCKTILKRIFFKVCSSFSQPRFGIFPTQGFSIGLQILYFLSHQGPVSVYIINILIIVYIVNNTALILVT